MSVASKITALDVSRRNFDQPYWTDYDAHKVNCSNWDLAMGVNLLLRLVLANSALYDSRVCITNRQRNQSIAGLYHAQKPTLDVTWMPDANECKKYNDYDSTHDTIRRTDGASGLVEDFDDRAALILPILKSKATIHPYASMPLMIRAESMPRGTLVTECSTSPPSALLARSINFMRTTYLNGHRHQNPPSVNTRSRVPTQHLPTTGKVTVNSPRHHEMPYCYFQT